MVVQACGICSAGQNGQFMSFFTLALSRVYEHSRDAWAKHKDLDLYEAKWLYVDALLKV